jgi:Mg-chelatase subunit ChlD
MAQFDQQTSLITILSCEHGRMRREERDIEKRDLQKALKYGSRTPSWGKRWKIEHDGIIFIADSTLRGEVTAYPSPLAFAEVDTNAHESHAKAKELIEIKPELCVSHTVLVVDNSGSMATHDIHLHRDRQTAAYTVTALEFVAEQLFKQTANNSDVVSLLEFSDKARVVFTREPVSWVLFNKLLKRRDERGFTAREGAKQMELYRCDSNYLPALDEAEKLLAIGNHDSCALSFLFLSDGAPSDARELGLTTAGAERRMCRRVAEIAEKFGKQKLNITMVGFGNKLQDFSALQSMAQTATDAPGDTKADFVYCNKMANSMGTAITSLVTSLTASRTELMEAGFTRGRTNRNIASEKEYRMSIDWKYYAIHTHKVFDPSRRLFAHYPGLPPGSLRHDNKARAKLLQKKPPQFLAIKTKTCGEGTERLAFRCQLSSGKSSFDFELGDMVAKETNLVERIEENVEFHTSFAETQSLASYLADEFNRRLCALPGYHVETTPRIEFLNCSILVLKDPDWPGGLRGVLVEKRLDTDRHGWTKWNNNAGGVDGRAAHAPLDVDRELAKLMGKMDMGTAGVILEGDSEEEDESSDDDDGDLGFVESEHTNRLKPSDYLQAFTHFTHRYTNKKVMVCDLQGVFDDKSSPPTFELSDPAIHYASSTGREMVYGRTDKGKTGMDLFHKTHRCSEICRHVLLGKVNSGWREEWSEYRAHES